MKWCSLEKVGPGPLVIINQIKMGSMFQQRLNDPSLGRLVESCCMKRSVAILQMMMIDKCSISNPRDPLTLSLASIGAPHSRRRSMVETEGKLQMGYLPTEEVSLEQARWRGVEPPRPLAPTLTNSYTACFTSYT